MLALRVARNDVHRPHVSDQNKICAHACVGDAYKAQAEKNLDLSGK